MVARGYAMDAPVRGCAPSKNISSEMRPTNRFVPSALCGCSRGFARDTLPSGGSIILSSRGHAWSLGGGACVGYDETLLNEWAVRRPTLSAKVVAN